MVAKSEITGRIGAPPPADAPIESAAPLHPSTVEHQQAMAMANERVLPPFAPKPAGRIAVAVAAVKSAILPSKAQAVAEAPIQGSDPSEVDQLISDVFGADVPVPVVVTPVQELPPLGRGVPEQDPMASSDVDQMEDVLPEITAEERARMPAASNTDTPSRGLLPKLVPDAAPDKFEGISRGGFTDVGDAQYFPLTGSEALELANALMDTMHSQIQNDLRFSMALVYPRIRMRLVLEVEGAVDDRDAGFTIEKVKAPKSGQPGSTPIEVARLRSDQVVFTLIAARQEFTADGQVDAPPDAIREELGLPRPRKQILTGPGGQQTMVDVVFPGADLGGTMS